MVAITKSRIKKERKQSKVLQYLQRIGKALLFPIALLPFAAIFLRIGAAVPTNTGFSEFINVLFSKIGGVVFDNLFILFAIGVSFGLAKDSRGEAAIVGFVVIMLTTLLLSSGGLNLSEKIYGNIDLGGVNYTDAQGNWLVETGNTAHFGFTAVFGNKFDAIMASNVLNGIIVGILVSIIYNNFNGIELPSVLGFFSGRRLIPVLGLIFGTFFIMLWALIFPWIGYAIYAFSDALTNATSNRWSKAGIMGVYGIINRLLIPFGLHHIPNNLFWFQLGSHVNAAGEPVIGDINIFLDGVAKGNYAGTFQSGFFPVMMFGLPAIALSFYWNADNAIQKKRVAALLFGSAIVSFFTGITEPIEFSFMFLAPVIYGFHAVLTGFWGFIVGLFGIQIGFGFSAGLIDFALSIPKSLEIIAANKTGIDAIMANPFWLFPIGALTAATYFFGSTILIRKFNMRAPGRGQDQLEDYASEQNESLGAETLAYENDAKIIIQSLGGVENINQVEWCSTRLRFSLNSNENIDEQAIKRTISRGLIKIGSNAVQIIIGPSVEIIGNTVLSLLSRESVQQISLEKSTSK